MVGTVCFFISLCWCLTPWGRAWDLFLYDSFFLLRGPRSPSGEIVIVAIDEPSFGVIGIQWPWPRSIHADLVDALFAAGARTVAIDILFPEVSAPGEDAALRKALKRHPSCILAADISRVEEEAYSQEIIIGPHPSLTDDTMATGYINIPVDPDGFIRSSCLGKPPMEALALAAVRRYLGPETQNREFKDGRINFAGPHRTIRTISYYQALSPNIHLPTGLLKDKLVFVGFNTQNISKIQQHLPDYFPTPFTRWGGGYMSGVEIHGNLAANLIQDNIIQVFPVFWILLISFGICVLTGMLFYRRKLLWGGGVVVLCWLVLGCGAFFLFHWKHLYVSFLFICLPVTSLYMVSPFFYYLESRREKNYIRQAFSTYVAPSVVQQLIENPQQLKLGGEQREITAFFSDVEGFTGISERLTPTELVGLLNEFLTEMTDIILGHEGTVDKFEGDAIIAMFGAPNQLPNHAEQACLACVHMQERLVSLRGDWQTRGLPPLKMRIGMCTGPAVVGNMGSSQRMDYTMMGDTVNTASRLEGANKAYHSYCLISESTRHAAGSAIAARQIDVISVFGKTEPFRVYEVLGIQGQLATSVHGIIEAYEKGLQAYQKRNWDRAADYFQQVLALRPEDGPSRTLLKRCREFRHHPPDRNWKGVNSMKTK